MKWGFFPAILVTVGTLIVVVNMGIVWSQLPEELAIRRSVEIYGIYLLPTWWAIICGLTFVLGFWTRNKKIRRPLRIVVKRS